MRVKKRRDIIFDYGISLNFTLSATSYEILLYHRKSTDLKSWNINISNSNIYFLLNQVEIPEIFQTEVLALVISAAKDQVNHLI